MIETIKIPKVCLCCQPRTGSSMVMRMLQFGGLSVKTEKSLKDRDFLNDFRNPYGLFEDGVYEGSSIKLFSFSKIIETMKIIYLERSVAEMSSSWEDVWNRQLKRGVEKTEYDALYSHVSTDWDKIFKGRSDILRLEYNSIHADPLASSKKISSFVDGEGFRFDYINASRAADKQLYIDRRK